MSYKSPLDFEFIRIPLPIQNRKKDLTSASMTAYGYLAKMHFTNEDGYIKINNKKASNDLNLSEKTIKDAFKILAGYGLVHTKKIGRLNAYKLMPINSNGYPETIPEYQRPKKQKPKPSTRGVLDSDRAPGGCSIPSTRGVLYIEHQGGAQSQDLPIIEESLKESFKEMLPQGIFFEKYGSEPPKGIKEKFRIKELDEYTVRFGDEFIDTVRLSQKKPSDERAKWVRGFLNNMINAEPMQNEQIAIDESNAHKLDFVAAPDRLSDLSSVVGQSF